MRCARTFSSVALSESPFGFPTFEIPFSGNPKGDHLLLIQSESDQSAKAGSLRHFVEEASLMLCIARSKSSGFGCVCVCCLGAPFSAWF